jgi:1,2-diacylglycerol 3-beta-glucosyltransferase
MMWTLLLTVPIFALGVLLLLPTFSELLSFLRPWSWQTPTRTEPTELPRFVYLVLAHDEEMLIAGTVRSLLAQDYPAPKRHVIVVADNCSDATARIAREAGAEVWERDDRTQRGKPFAIAWALGRIPLAEYDGLIIVDADCEVTSDYARQLARRGPLRGKVLQPVIGVRNPTETALTRMASVHGMVTHGLAYRVKERAGLNAPLGVGMCLGTDVLRAEPWSAFSVAEDWELYCILTVRGVRIEPVQEARISAQEAKSLAQSGPQRHRWLAGKVGVLQQYFGAILRSPNLSLPQKLDAVAELTFPGPAVHLGIAGLLAAIAWLAGPPLGALAAAVVLASLIRPVLYTALAIAKDESPARAIAAFAYLPVYTAWRIGPALRSIVASRLTRWVRTERHAAEGP